MLKNELTNKYSDNEVFEALVSRFAKQYPRANLSVEWKFDRNIVCAYGRECFCPDGYNLLYNIKRLANVLESELR